MRPVRQTIIDEADRVALALGDVQARLVRQEKPKSLRDAEFHVFSQWGEDGVIQHLLSEVAVPRRLFVEIGVGNYSESNTRFLATHDAWRGVAIDSGSAHDDFIRRHELDWRLGLTAVSAFVTADNVNDLIQSAEIAGDIGLLSVDVDGVDYWLLEAIDVIRPRIIVIEYNAVFGHEARVTVPYRADFVASQAHRSGIYFGASLAALVHLAGDKGYIFVGCESHGANAFFVRADAADSLKAVSVADGYVENCFRTSRSESGELDFASDRIEKLHRIRELPLVDVASGNLTTVADVFAV